MIDRLLRGRMTKCESGRSEKLTGDTGTEACVKRGREFRMKASAGNGIGDEIATEACY